VFAATLSDGKTKIGELDEEFVYETRPGDVFALGSHTWRVTEVTTDQSNGTRRGGRRTPHAVLARRCHVARLRSRRGDRRFRREVAERIHDPSLSDWLKQECALDDNSARNVIEYVQGQTESVGAISSDKTIIVEIFADAVGEPRMVIQSPFGGKVNGPWGLALASVLREETGVDTSKFRAMMTVSSFVSPAQRPWPPTDVVKSLAPRSAPAPAA